MSDFWSWWIIIIVAINILGCWGLLYWTRKVKESEVEDSETTGHVYDGITEYNNPLPRWWLIMFYITLVFGVGYLILYPGLGKFDGILGWSPEKQLEEEVQSAEAIYQPLFEKYLAVPIPELAKVEQATEMGKRIFLNVCAGCHGSDASGYPSYPNLTDDDWLWGGAPKDILHTINNGRVGMMPGFEQILSAEQIDELVQYVGSLSGNQVNQAKAAAGAKIFAVQCAACHGPEGKGNMAIGAPNLTDDVWLYGGSATVIAQGIRNGRNNQMPALGGILGEARTHLVAAYVYSLSNEK